MFSAAEEMKTWKDIWTNFNLEGEKKWINEWMMSKQKTKSSHSIFFENDHRRLWLYDHRRSYLCNMHTHIYMHTPYIMHITWGLRVLYFLSTYCLQNIFILFTILLFGNFIHAYNVFGSYTSPSFLLLQFLLMLPTKIPSQGQVLCF